MLVQTIRSRLADLVEAAGCLDARLEAGGGDLDALRQARLLVHVDALASALEDAEDQLAGATDAAFLGSGEGGEAWAGD